MIISSETIATRLENGETGKNSIYTHSDIFMTLLKNIYTIVVSESSPRRATRRQDRVNDNIWRCNEH